MKDLLHKSPLVLLTSLAFSVAMFAPAVFGFVTNDATSARSFLYAGILGSGLSFGVMLATSNRDHLEHRRALLLTLIYVFAVIPVFLAIPVQDVMRTTTLAHAYLDMVSALTTTALPVFENSRLTDTLVFWRSIVAWIGGLYIWTAAFVIFMPLRLGGFEVLPDDGRHLANRRAQHVTKVNLPTRFLTELQKIFPIYVGLTAALGFFLVLSGHDELSAWVYAAGAVSTAGYHPNSGSLWAGGSFGAEAVVFLVLLFALSRRMFGRQFGLIRRGPIWTDSELRLGLTIIVLVATLLFIRHFLGAASVRTTDDPLNLWMALWGGIFTALSFLTTTGYVSEGWIAAQNWSGLSNSGVILVTLSMIGGGVATTAGGLKLLRVSSLLRHSQAEVEQLTSPRRVMSSKDVGFGGEVQNAIWAWVFMMFFFAAFAVLFAFLAYSGTSFENGLIVTMAALTNAGPLVDVASTAPQDVLDLSGLGKTILVVAMILGRVETLAFVALLNPDIWRK